MTYADRFTRTAAKRAKMPDIPLPTAKEMKEALTLKQARTIKPAGKRHGNDVAKALSMYAGVCAAARCDIKALDRGPQGDTTEQTKLNIIGETKSNWASVAPKPATKKEKKS